MTKVIKEKLFAVVASCGHIVRIPGGPLAIGSTQKQAQNLATWSNIKHEFAEDWKVVELVEKEVYNG